MRDRGEDVALLAQYFVERHAQTSGRKAPVLDAAASQALEAYPWPGNVRELQNCLERAAILCDRGVITPRHLHLVEAAAPAASEPAAPDLAGTLAEVVERAQQDAERRKIAAVLAETGNDTARAADLLGVGFRVLVAKMRAYDLGTQ